MSGSFCFPKLVGSHLIWTERRLFRAPQPEEHIVRWASRLLFRGGTFFDVGAHYGWIAITAAHRVGKSGRVIAFEPAPILLNILLDHKRVNRLPQIEVVAKAVSDVNADSVPFFLVNEGLSVRNSLTIGPDDTPYVTTEEKTKCDVGSVTLDRFVADCGIIPDAVKVDVEGAELLVLRGAEELLDQHHPPLILGVHSYWLPRSQTVGQILDLLNRHEYQIEEEYVIPFQGGYVADYLCTYGRTKP